MAALEPVDDGLVIAVAHQCVTEHAVFHPAVQGVDDGLRHAEVHVGHPHGQRSLGFFHIPFVAAGAAALDDFVEKVGLPLSPSQGGGNLWVVESVSWIVF